jgi:hypothetical protein
MEIFRLREETRVLPAELVITEEEFLQLASDVLFYGVKLRVEKQWIQKEIVKASK